MTHAENQWVLTLDRRRKALEQVLADMGLAARDLGAPAGTDPKDLVLSSATLSELEQARERMRDAEAAVTREQGEVAAIEEKIEAAKEHLGTLGAETSITVNLAEIFERFDVDAVLMSDPGQAYGVLQFATDRTLAARITRLPDQLDGAPEDLSGAEVATRQVSLDMGMGGMMMGGGGFAINGRPYDMRRIDFEVALGSVERWRIHSTMVAHPFHVHGVRFRVVSENGGPPRPENTGWKDSVLVPGEAEILARFDQPASRETPFMFHCHILEHEDAGMMGQFTVT